jgi:hypothetical protein
VPTRPASLPSAAPAAGANPHVRRAAGQIIWETGGQDWVDELKDNEYKMAKPPVNSQPTAPAAAPAPAPRATGGSQKRKRPVKEAKILVYGLPNSGKTSIINKLADEAGLGPSEPAGPTHMFNVNRMHWNDVRLTVFDFGGKTEWRRALWKSYFDQADALVRPVAGGVRAAARTARATADHRAWRVRSQVWVVDSTDRTHLETCKEELLAMLGARRKRSPRAGASAARDSHLCASARVRRDQTSACWTGCACSCTPTNWTSTRIPRSTSMRYARARPSRSRGAAGPGCGQWIESTPC